MNSSVYVVAGPNGAGKTTFATEFLPNYAECRNFVNADLIAEGMSPFSPEAAAFRAGRLVLEEIAFYAKRGESFGFETTLSGHGHLGLIRRLKHQGYQVHFFYLWVSSVELALSRIRARVALGGHDVPSEAVRRRFDRSVRNFLVLYRSLADSWTLYDNTSAAPRVIASEEHGDLRIEDVSLYTTLVERYAKR